MVESVPKPNAFFMKANRKRSHRKKYSQVSVVKPESLISPSPRTPLVVTGHYRNGDWNILFLVAAILVPLALASRNWLFDGLGDIDAFKYVGLFLNYGRHLVDADADYKISRLPWVLPGVLFYKLFAPRVAHYILQLTFTFAATLFLYLSIKSLFNSRVALLTSLIYTTDHWFHGPSMWASGGWNYHNTACLAYYFAALFFVLEGTLRQNRKALFAAGLSMAACVFTTVFMAPLVMALAAVGCFCLLRTSERRLSDLRYLLAGGLIMALLLSLASLFTGGRLLFFLPEWRYTLAVSKQNIYFRPPHEYLKEAYWLAYPVLTTVSLGLLWCFYPYWRETVKPEQRKLVLLIHAQFVLVAAYFVLLSTVLHQSVLQFPQIVMPLAGPMMPAIAAVLYVSERNRKLPDGLLTGTLVTVIMLAVPWAIVPPLVGGVTSLLGKMFGPFASVPVLVPLVAGIVCIFYRTMHGHRASAVIGTALCLAAVNSLSFPYQSPLSWNAPCCVIRDAFDGIVDANRFLTEFDSSPGANRMIYSFAEHLPDSAGQDIFLSQVFNSIGSTRFCPKMYDWVTLPHWSDQEFNSNKTIAILSSLKNQEPFTREFIDQATRHGVRFSVAAQKQFRRGPIIFAISMLTQR